MIDSRASQLSDPIVTDPSRRGRSGFLQHVKQLNRVHDGLLQKFDASQEHVAAAYVHWVKNGAPELASYFQLINEALRFLDKSLQTKQPYADILRATLSPAEKHLLFYHGLFSDSGNDFAELLARYRIFDGFDMHVPDIIPASRLHWYPKE